MPSVEISQCENPVLGTPSTGRYDYFRNNRRSHASIHSSMQTGNTLIPHDPPSSALNSSLKCSLILKE